MDEEQSGWSRAEKKALIKLARMALVLLLAIVVAGTIAALLSSSVGAF